MIKKKLMKSLLFATVSVIIGLSSIAGAQLRHSGRQKPV